MKQSKICPKCQGEMKRGTLSGQEIDWENNGEHSFLKNEGRKINTYACIKCGYMESYVNG